MNKKGKDRELNEKWKTEVNKNFTEEKNHMPLTYEKMFNLISN